MINCFEGKCKIVCKISAYNFFIKVLERKIKKPIFAVPKKEPKSVPGFGFRTRVVGSVVQLVRMLPCHGRGRGFESRPVR